MSQSCWKMDTELDTSDANDHISIPAVSTKPVAGGQAEGSATTYSDS